jgi:PPOX class probable F420-dependent enzyme
VYFGDHILIYSQPDRQKLRNIRNNPRINLNLNSNAYGGDVVPVEGTARIVEDAPPANEIGQYVEKYRGNMARIRFEPDGFAQAYSVAIRVKPTRWQAGEVSR